MKRFTEYLLEGTKKTFDLKNILVHEMLIKMALDGFSVKQYSVTSDYMNVVYYAKSNVYWLEDGHHRFIEYIFRNKKKAVFTVDAVDGIYPHDKVKLFQYKSSMKFKGLEKLHRDVQTLHDEYMKSRKDNTL